MIGLLSRLPWRATGWLTAIAATAFLFIGLYFAIRDAGLQQGRAEVQAAWDEEKAVVAEHLRWQEETLRARAASDDEANTARLAEIAAADAALQSSLKEAMKHDEKYRDSRCAADASVLDAINASRLRRSADPPARR